MGRIAQLDKQTANRIAAGEVVERPMGVVKELVENAIDAGSTRITVSIEEGGLKKITITDNGCGMDAEDAEMCFQRHATSKIHSENDLWSIHTLGFRGEALPSIASVAKVTLVTSDGEDSTRVVIAYGKDQDAGSYPCSQGTEISVEGLFYETPARLKHMRSSSYEASLIQDVVQKFALSHPEIAFRFINDGRDAFRTSGQDDLLEVLYGVFGRSAAENVEKIDCSDYDYHLTGYIVKPIVSRSSKSLMHIFLNGRMVRTYRLYKAVQDGYGSYLPEGRYPLCVLNIEMDPHLLDVNVHPSKWEVRISKENQLEHLLMESVAKALKKDIQAPEPEIAPIRETYYQPLSFDQEDLRPTETKEEPKTVAETFAMSASTIQQMKAEAKEDEEILRQLHAKVEEVPKEEEEIPSFPVMHIIGQYRKKYILAECENGLALIDQHAAQRKIAYEKVRKKLVAEAPQIPCLLPVTMVVGDAMVDRVEELNEAVRSCGIHFEPFGKDTLVVRSLPSWTKDLEEESFLNDLVQAFKEENISSFTRKIKDRIALVASRNVSEKIQSFTREEMQALVDALSHCENPYQGVNGGSILVILGEQELEKEFA